MQSLGDVESTCHVRPAFFKPRELLTKPAHQPPVKNRHNNKLTFR